MIENMECFFGITIVVLYSDNKNKRAPRQKNEY